ncbi:MAG: TRAP transporter small permease [Rhizobiaceae bacterium]
MNRPSIASLPSRLAIRVGSWLVMIIVAACSYEIVMRYFFASPTIWANELSLFVGGIIFVLSGISAARRGEHARVTLLYDMVSARLRRLLDAIALVCIVAFSAALVVGGYPSAARALVNWERFGSSWDAPIPAVLKPLILLIAVWMAADTIVRVVAKEAPAEDNKETAGVD